MPSHQMRQWMFCHASRRFYFAPENRSLGRMCRHGDARETLLVASPTIAWRKVLSVWTALLVIGNLGQLEAQSWPPIERRLPPVGIELTEDQHASLQTALDEAQQQLATLPDRTYVADIEMLLKAVRFALLHREFYKPEQVDWAHELLNLANQRLVHLNEGKTPWRAASGRVVRGYRSSIDGSAQPYGLELPDDWQARPKPLPLYVWLHGRGDKTTDLHFIRQRIHSGGTIDVADAIVVHPFGRQCIGYKSAGEIDVIECVAHVMSEYPIDPNRVVLMGFSMGGAGAWHVGAHYADRWVVVSPGAGFAETREYNRLKPDQFPPSYEQTLWGLYDVPAYTRNLFNVPVIAYSGENDKQIQAARMMETAFQRFGRQLDHRIGPGMGHKYHPDTLAAILQRIEKAVEQGRDPAPAHVQIQTRTLRYSRMFWLQLLQLDQHWQDSTADAKLENGKLRVETRGVRTFEIDRMLIDPTNQLTEFIIDQQPLSASGSRFTKDANGHWKVLNQPLGTLVKQPGLQGPIDDLFLGAFMVVLPNTTAESPMVQRWLEFEIEHLQQRWRALFRGDLIVKRDHEVTEQDIEQYHLLLWGTPASNRLIGVVQTSLPIRWTEENVTVGDQTYPADQHLPALIYPNPLNPNRYVLLNSGPTFREGHDRTNSLQNPKLPDWCIFKLGVPPNALQAGEPVATGFFDEQWQLKP